MSINPTPGQIYRHFKGNFYKIITLAEHSETGETMVVYQAMYGDGTVYVRPLLQFLERLDKAEYPNAAQEYRFELKDEEMSEDEMGRYVGSSENRIEKDKEASGNGKKQEGSSENKTDGDTEEVNIDPLVLEFLDTSSYRERLRILSELHHRITDDMINIMAMATDLEIKEGDTEERFEELRACLATCERYEGSRLR